MAFIAGRFVVVSAVQIRAVAVDAHRRRRSAGVEIPIPADGVLDGTAVLPFFIGMALGAGRLARRSALKIDPMAGRAILVGQAVIRLVQDAPQIDRVAERRAIGAGPIRAVALGAGRFPVQAALERAAVALRTDPVRLTGIGAVKDSVQIQRMDAAELSAVGVGPERPVTSGAGGLAVGAALQGAAVAGRAVVDRAAEPVGMEMAAEVDAVVEVHRRARRLAGHGGVLGDLAGERKTEDGRGQGQSRSDARLDLQSRPPTYEILSY